MKTAWAAIVGFAATLFASVQNELFAILFLILIDTATGVWAAVKQDRKSFSSKKLRKVVSKIIVYVLAILVVKVTENYLSSTIPWEDVVTGVLSAIEVTSILENMSKILGYDLIGKVREKINEKLKSKNPDQKDQG